ncbi:hypothetical protein VTJ04DRAFT_3033 [Mycothermus thermophilus]|uniref:uncharacterized protein n=1 Tax=Humicola insolens TaxID=85995 RepID=UPI003741FAB7
MRCSVQPRVFKDGFDHPGIVTDKIKKNKNAPNVSQPRYAVPMLIHSPASVCSHMYERTSPGIRVTSMIHGSGAISS